MFVQNAVVKPDVYKTVQPIVAKNHTIQIIRSINATLTDKLPVAEKCNFFEKQYKEQTCKYYERGLSSCRFVNIFIKCKHNKISTNPL